MHLADIGPIEDALHTYHRCYVTQYAFYDDTDGDIGEHEEVVLREQAEGSKLSAAMEDALPSGVAPEQISAEAFYGGMYFWPKRTLVYSREKTTKRPIPIYYASTGKALSSEDYRLFNTHYDIYDRNKKCVSEYNERHGYACMFQVAVLPGLSVVEINEIFHKIEQFMCKDIKLCTIYDWRADLASHCVSEFEYGGCEGNYLWTLSCPIKRRITLIRWHLNQVWL